MRSDRDCRALFH